MPRTLDNVLEDIRKLTELTDMLKLVGDGYTVNQRIEHHERMAELLKEFREITTDHTLLPN